MSEAVRQAIFLSYAREDTDAVRRIAEALTRQGIEVWFDQSELRGGDAWDAKIRRQLKECALFLPVISANTQARREGYFRAEWRQADQRTHLMGRDKAFLVPVCIDDTSENDADVPDSFVAVQWTRLPGGQTTDAFARRLQALLAGEAIAGSAAQRTARSSPAAMPHPSTPARSSPWKWLAPLLVAAAALAAALLWHGRSATSSRPAAQLPPDAALDLEKARQLTGSVNYGPQDLALAEGFAAKATDAAPDSAPAWACRGMIQALCLLRTWDTRKDRQRDAQVYCQRALALDPNNVEAMLGLAYGYINSGAFADAEALMRKAVRLAPQEPRCVRALGVAVSNSDGHAAGLAILHDAVRRFPRDPLCWYELGLHQWYDHQQAAALASFRQAVTLAPMASAYVAIAELLALRGDLPGADAAIAQIPVEARSGDRAVGIEMWLGILEHNPTRVFNAEARTSAEYFTDAQLLEPKAFLTALAYRMAGKENLAAREWDTSISVLRQRLETNPSELDRINLATALASRGRTDEATRVIGTIAAAESEMDQPDHPRQLARYFAARGDAAQAVAFLMKYRHAELFDARMDPWWDMIRDKPEFKAYLTSNAHLQAEWK